MDKNWPNAVVLRDTSASGAELAHHVFGREELLSSRRPIEGSKYAPFDAQRSVRQLIEPTGTVSDEYTFDAWGNALLIIGSSANLFRFSGEIFDAETGLIYLRARWYNPSTGLFIGPDPMLGTELLPSSLHRYLYGGADPINRRDPSGAYFVAAIAPVALSNIGQWAEVNTARGGKIMGYQDQPSILNKAVDDAQDGMRRAAATTGYANMYSIFFDSGVAARGPHWELVESTFLAMERALANNEVEYRTHAYDPDRPPASSLCSNINLAVTLIGMRRTRTCLQFFEDRFHPSRQRTGVIDRDRAYTILHELAHAVGVGLDRQYGLLGIKLLADTDPGSAAQNADSYSWALFWALGELPGPWRGSALPGHP